MSSVYRQATDRCIRLCLDKIHSSTLVHHNFSGNILSTIFFGTTFPFVPHSHCVFLLNSVNTVDVMNGIKSRYYNFIRLFIVQILFTGGSCTVPAPLHSFHRLV